VIDSLFAGPIEVLQCLAAYGKPVKTPQDASLFLLAHRTRIVPYLVGDREAALEMLKSLVVHLANDPSDHLTLSLRYWSISPEGCVTLPSIGLQDLALDTLCNRNELLEMSEPCSASLEHNGKDIFFSIAYRKNLNFVVRNYAVPSKKSRHKKTAAVVPSRAADNTKRCPICHELLSKNHWKAHAELLSRIRVENEPRAKPGDIGLGSGGSIWAVSGGLPSLGKRAR
jgi:hypothetical protein